ncbi:Zinc finger, ZPR1-type domain-containing protein [Rozella allomycis CSF55]|uniref:Zinc finger, ZPR1-type domain-containing protein n=1 Tax=Rozella allomycis (strain CSF55) TaxID=988480 RepID=A0A075B527_ROZAC|nr:Zinc finger, ZPR1-type domain-containing protein [Rozella allomycis CSF55]|eukprot:EPZ36861.1 Zinc finger, ZPR1-type domain-containing protein [Rozella allomycis CSF55]
MTQTEEIEQNTFTFSNEENLATECNQCGILGTSNVFNTEIPGFKSITVIAFECEFCGYKRNKVPPAPESDMRSNGCKINLKILDKSDFERDEFIDAADLEIPPTTKFGVYNTVGGFIQRAIEDLEFNQPQRQKEPEFHSAISMVIQKLSKLLELNEPFEIQIEDPTGNSFIENLKYPSEDANLTAESVGGLEIPIN